MSENDKIEEVVKDILTKMIDRAYLGISKNIPPCIVRQDIDSASKEILSLLHSNRERAIDEVIGLLDCILISGTDKKYILSKLSEMRRGK